jgi:hypothetical protein
MAGPGSNLSPRSGDLEIWGALVGLGLEWSYTSGTWFGWDTWSGGLDSGETIANPGCHLLAGSVQFLSMMACISDCTLDGICEEQIGSRAQDVDPSLSVAGAGARQPYEVRLFLGLKSEVKSSCPCFPAQTHRRNWGSGDLQEDWQGEVGTLYLGGAWELVGGTGDLAWVPGDPWEELGTSGGLGGLKKELGHSKSVAVTQAKACMHQEAVPIGQSNVLSSLRCFLVFRGRGSSLSSRVKAFVTLTLQLNMGL